VVAELDTRFAVEGETSRRGSRIGSAINILEVCEQVAACWISQVPVGWA
jgi:hypothetical protein